MTDLFKLFWANDRNVSAKMTQTAFLHP